MSSGDGGKERKFTPKVPARAPASSGRSGRLSSFRARGGRGAAMPRGGGVTLSNTVFAPKIPQHRVKTEPGVGRGAGSAGSGASQRAGGERAAGDGSSGKSAAGVEGQGDAGGAGTGDREKKTGRGRDRGRGRERGGGRGRGGGRERGGRGGRGRGGRGRRGTSSILKFNDTGESEESPDGEDAALKEEEQAKKEDTADRLSVTDLSDQVVTYPTCVPFRENTPQKKQEQSAAAELLKSKSGEDLFFLQLPSVLPTARMSSGATGDASPAAVPLKHLPDGFLGTLRVYKSGKMKMAVGNVLYDVTPGTPVSFHQELVVFAPAQEACYSLGDVTGRMVLTPDIEHLMNSSNSGQ